MTYPDFQARAELYLGSDWQTASAQGARSFRTAAQAIRFALEEAAPVSLRGARLIIGDMTFSREQLTWLYRSPDYPLPRKHQDNPSRSRRRQSTVSKGNSNGHRLRSPSRALRRQALRQDGGGPVPALQHSF
jgi:hypothetical protein